MGNRGNIRHLTSEQIQGFLDHGLASDEASVVQAHLTVCSHCREELEEWSVLFSDLGTLEDLAPGPGFSAGVMTKLPSKASLPTRVRRWLGNTAAPAAATQHLPAEEIQDYLDSTLPAREALKARGHLAACQDCEDEVRRWNGLFGILGALGHLAPAPGFAERVMARIRIPAPVPTPWAAAGDRVLGWVRGFLPQTRRGWAVAGGVASAPTITLAALFYLVFSHPLLTAGTFTTYVSWKASALLSSAFSAVAAAAVDSVTLFRAYTVLGALAESPLLVGVGGLVFSLLSAVALWVLHRNLVATKAPERSYARARV